MATESTYKLPPGCVAAVYNKPENPQWQGNPFIEALPSLKADGQTNYPHVGTGKGGNKHGLVHTDGQSSKREVWNHWQTAIFALVCDGYISRNPIPTESSTTNATLRPRHPIALHSDQTGFSVIALNPSVHGKTTAVKQLLRRLSPPVIAHTQYEGKVFGCLHVPALFIILPNSSSPKALLSAFIRELDSLLATNYHTELASGCGSLETMVSTVELHIAKHGIGLVILDDIYSAFDSNARNGRKLLKLIEHIGTTCGVPFVLIGCRSVLPWPATFVSRTA
jgi:hypothetical protein